MANGLIAVWSFNKRSIIICVEATFNLSKVSIQQTNHL